MPEFTIPDFLRLVGKGPKLDEDMEPLNQKYWYYDDAISELQCIAPFADILTAWTPEKDALLLGAGLEWIKASPVGTFETVGNSLADMKCHAERESKYDRAAFAMGCNTVSHQPGLTLARAIWDAMKGGNK
jgi:hypothetical protein